MPGLEIDSSSKRARRSRQLMKAEKNEMERNDAQLPSKQLQYASSRRRVDGTTDERVMS